MIMHGQRNSQWILLPAFALAVTLVALVLPTYATAQEQPATASTIPPAPPASGRNAIMSKLNSIIIDKVNFNKLDIATAVDFLTAKSKELDPDHVGINFVLNLPPDAPHVHREISMTLENVPLIAVLKYMTEQANLVYSVDAYAVDLRPVIGQGTAPGAASPAQPSNAQSGSALIQNKLQTITLSLDFSNATIAEATEFLNVKSKELAPDKKGINFVISPDAASSAKTITLNLNNVSMGEALRYICQLAGVQYKVQDDAIEIVPL